MNTSELFFQSALLNAFIFCFIACASASARILLRLKVKTTTALLVSALFGPLAFAGSFLYESFAKNKEKLKRGYWSLAAIVMVSAILIAIHYVLFIMGDNAVKSDSLNSATVLMVIVGGFFGGIVLSIFTSRVSFFESAWCAFLCSVYVLTLYNWADDVFSYGTSFAYFFTLIFSATILLFIFLILGGAIGYLIYGEGKLNLHCSYESFIGLRFLMAKRASQVVSLITMISIIAVMISCAGMIVVMSVMNGFTSDLRSKILGANAHLMVLKYGNDFDEYEEVVKKTKDIEGIKAATPFVLKEGMISSHKNLSGAVFTGIDLDKSLESEGVLKYIEKESIEYLKNPKTIPVLKEASLTDDLDDTANNQEENDMPGIILGKEMAISLQAFVGDSVNVISPVGDIGPTGPIPKAKAFRVAGLFYSGMYEYDAKFAYIKLKDAQSFFNMNNTVTGVEYRLQNAEDARLIASKVSDAIAGYPFYTRDWMQMNRPMFSALQLEKIAMLIILGTLIFMASLLILVTLIMVVIEKGKEIAILKSMGATDVSVMKIFVTYGLFIGTCGAAFGGALGVAMCMLIKKLGIRLDPDIYYFSSLPIKIVSFEVLLVIIAAILISFLATIPPSLFAARLKPVEGLRYE